MVAILRLLAAFIADLFKSRRRLEGEILFLRHQLNIALRRRPARLRLRGSDRALLVWMTRLWPSLLGMARVVEPATILRWHRAGFRSYWRWKSRKRAGRPRIDRDLRDLIRRMSKENPLWGAPRIHGELLKLGFELAKSTVSTYMIRRRHPPSQSWRTFLRNHAEAIAAIDLCLVPTVRFESLFALVVIGHGRRQLLWFAVTRHPTAEWLAQQIIEAFPWETAPVVPENWIRPDSHGEGEISASLHSMVAILRLLAAFIADLFKSRRRLEGEILFLRHQLNIALRRRPARLRLRGSDRALLVWMTRLWPSLLGMARVVEPATILRWHRAGFRKLLALEIAKAGRAAADRSRPARSDPTNEQREPVVGRSPHPW